MSTVPARRQKASELQHQLVDLEAFAKFRTTVDREIGKLPTIVFESIGLAGHRARVFTSPPSVEVVVSERDIWNYVRFFDLLVHVKRNEVPRARSHTTCCCGAEPNCSSATGSPG